MKVAVIGAGAAGLVSARELIRCGHEITVFEQSERVGGIWVYEAEPEDDLLGLSPSNAVFSSLYDSLRTNLPRDLMAFQDYTFDSSGGGDDYWQRYPHHSKVLEYLENFAKDFDLLRYIKFSETVVSMVSENEAWLVATESGHQDIFDPVMICNGHYSRPRVPHIPGIDKFTGLTIHSHNYRNNDQFAGKRVAVFGAAASGIDIAWEISQVATDVYWSGGIFDFPARTIAGNIYLYPSPLGFSGNTLEFTDGISVEAIDIFVYCTGYEYSFPFLQDDIVSITDNWIYPLYQEMLPPEYASLAFMGVPSLVIPFPLFEMQARWYARVLAGKVKLPSPSLMQALVQSRHDKLVDEGQPVRHFHKLADKQEAYVNQLAEECGDPALPEWFGKLAIEAQHSRQADPENFRDKAMSFHGASVVKYR